jgi:hypothetical protein
VDGHDREHQKLGNGEASWQSKVAKQNPAAGALPTPAYLDHPRPRKNGDKFRGGTVIDPRIKTLDDHTAALANPDLIRPRECAACRCPVLHVHDRRTRNLDGRGSATTEVLVFRCVRCRVVWRVLPAWLARHLWRTWEAVSEALDEARSRSETPERTRQRWRERLRERAAMLVVVLGQLGPARAPAVAALELLASRGDVLEAFGGLARLAGLAALIDHLVPGVRVM